MNQKVFVEKNSYQLVSDERDIMLPWKLTKEIQTWCNANNIIAEQNPQQVILQTAFGVALWRIKDEKQRMWFALRWSS